MSNLLGNVMTRGQLAKVDTYIPRTKEELIARLLIGQIVLVFTKYRNQWIPCFLEMNNLGIQNISQMTFKIPTYSEFVVWKFIDGVSVYYGVNYVYKKPDQRYKRVIHYRISQDQCRQLTIY